MKSVWLSAVLLATMVAACGKSGGEVGVIAGAPAGDVTEVAGAVTATRAGVARPLHVGDAVAGDDVIATGPDGRIAITLRHNHVPWSLGPGKSKRVADSAAWAATEGASLAEVADERSGAAGRHAERNAADTAATEVAPAVAMAPTAAAPAAPIAAPDPAPSKPSGRVAIEPPAPRVAQTRAADADSFALADGGGGGGTDTGLGNAGSIGRGAGSTGAGGSAAPAPGTVKVLEVAVSPGAVEAAVARRVILARTGVIRACYQKELARDATLAGAIPFALAIKPGGEVATVTAQPPAALVATGDCVRRQLARLRFPAAKAAWTATTAIAFDPAP